MAYHDAKAQAQRSREKCIAILNLEVALRREALNDQIDTNDTSSEYTS